MVEKPKIGVFYWHNPTRLGNLELVGRLRQDFSVTIISNEDTPIIKRFSDDVIVEHFGNLASIRNKLRNYKSSFGLDGLITLSEGAVTLLADVTSDLGLVGNDPKSARFGRNKYLMRQRMREIGVPQPDFYRAYSIEGALSITKKFPGSFFLKPPCIGGSSFCSIINNREHLKKIWDDFFEGSKNRTKKDPLFEEQFGKNGEGYYMLIETLLGGTQFSYDDILGPSYPVFEMSVEGFIKGDSTYVYSMTDKLLPKDCTNSEEHMWRMHSRIPSALKKILKKRVSDINRSLKATCGCSHTEFRIEETKDEGDINYQGKNYQAKMIETAIRPGGAFMQPAIAMATGFNSIKAMAYQSCGIEHNEEVLHRFPMIMANLWPHKPGKLLRIEGVDKVLSLKENIGAFHLYDSIGDAVQVPPEASRGIADALIYGKNIDLNTVNNWETKFGNDNPYKEAEKGYLQIVNNFKPIVG